MEYSNIEIYGTECCDECCEVIYNQFNCPICNTFELLTTNENLDYESVTIKCEKCGTKFKKHEEDEKDSWYYIDRLVLVEES